MSFWKDLKRTCLAKGRPFFILAPMDDVTDVVFREVITWTGKPDVFFSEFTNVDGLNSKGREKLIQRFKFSENQRPIVAQLWGKVPENYFKAARDVKELMFDGIDLNMGCPERSVLKSGNCAALINNQSLAKDIIQATIKGGGGLPVSVKTRLGFDRYQGDEWFPFLLNLDLAAITVHGRTAREMSKVPANWEEIGKVVKIRDQINPNILIIGNGDVIDIKHGEKLSKKYGVDGVMIGRGIFRNPWIFNKTQKKHSKEERLNLALKHARLFVETWGVDKNINILNKFFKIYVSGFDGAAELRVKLMEAKSFEEIEKYLGVESCSNSLKSF